MTVFKSMFGFFLYIFLCIYGKLLFVVTMRFMYCCLVAKSCPTLLSPTDCQALLPMNFPGKNTGVSFHFLLQRIFPTQGLNPCLLHWRVDSLPLSHQGMLCEILSWGRVCLCSHLRFPTRALLLPGRADLLASKNVCGGEQNRRL